MNGKKHKKKESTSKVAQPPKSCESSRNASANTDDQMAQPDVKSTDPCTTRDQTLRTASPLHPSTSCFNNPPMSNRRAENTSNANGFLASGPDILPHPLNTSERSCDPSERSHDPIASIATHHFCSICDVNCNSPANLLTHCKGRRHRESVKIALRGASLYAEDFKKALSFKAGLDFLSEMRTQAPHGWQDFINAVRRGTRALQRLDFESYPGEPQEESAPTAVTQLHHVCSICVVNCNSSANLLAHSYT